MIRLSVNVLSAVTVLLKNLDTYSFSSLNELVYFSASMVDTEDVFALAKTCGWAEEKSGVPLLTAYGKELLTLQDKGKSNILKKQLLSDYILKTSPIWANRIPYGRREATIFMSKDEEFCFFEAGLLEENLDSDVVKWWDNLASLIRRKSENEKGNIGRKGEKHTVEYERIRTESEPRWMAVDSNLVGYDVMSRRSKDNPSALLIEVKTSSLPLEHSLFYVTSHEWDVANTSEVYQFHLWCLHGGKKLLAVLTPDDIRPNIPTNNYEGFWDNTKIPFSCYKDRFILIP